MRGTDQGADKMRQGRLVYLMGASGAGKDSLIEAAREALYARDIDVVRRVITRSAEAKGEQAVGVTREAFERMLDQGSFALSWGANGLMYGIPAAIDHSLAKGHWVLVNGSRGYLPQALDKYPDLLAVLVTVKNDVLRQRLLNRGRETPAEIERRLLRNERLHHTAADWQGEAPRLHTIDNSGALDDAAAALLALIDRYQVSAVED